LRRVPELTEKPGGLDPWSIARGEAIKKGSGEGIRMKPESSPAFADFEKLCAEYFNSWGTDKLMLANKAGGSSGDPGRTRTCNPLIKRPSKEN
jgi:hypothetical protein